MDNISGALKRPRFEPADYLAAADLSAEQAWRRQRFRRHNRHLHEWGIVCGLFVVPALDAARPWGAIVCPGYALGPYGDEIVVGCAVRIDLREWIWSQPPGSQRVAYVGVRYAESTGVPRPFCSGGCDGDAREAPHSMVAEEYRIDVIWSRPDAGPPTVLDICHGTPPCAPCSSSPHVLLAAVRLPSDEGTALTRSDVDLAVRRLV